MKNYNLVKNESGVWKVVTDPQVPRFHYYSLIIDGVSVADPASESFYGMGRMASGIEIPEKGLKVEFASFPGAHEWQVWRKSLNDFAQKLFR